MAAQLAAIDLYIAVLMLGEKDGLPLDSAETVFIAVVITFSTSD